MTNPFTGEVLTVYIDDGMTPQEAHAAALFLNRTGASGPDPEGFRSVKFVDGNSLEVNLMQNGAEINVKSEVSMQVAVFIFQLASAAGMFLTSAVDPESVAILPGQHHVGLDARWPMAVRIVDAEDLRNWIENEMST